MTSSEARDDGENVIPEGDISANPENRAKFTPRSLVGASPEEVAQVAIEYTYVRFKPFSETTDVVIARRPTNKDLSLLGFPVEDYDPEDYPLMLVVLKGDFDVTNMRGGSKGHNRVGYIVYLVDMRAGLPSLTLTSVTGGKFRELLDDPTLPEDPVANPEALEALKKRNLPEAVVVPPEPRRTEKLPYGSIAPPIQHPRNPQDLPPYAPPDSRVDPE